MDLPIRRPNRMPGFDYSRQRVYYITIKVETSSEFLSRIDSGQLTLYNFGKIIKNTWDDIPNHYNICSLDEYIIMPDHFHGILFTLGIGGSNNPSIPTIIGAFKSIASKRINKINTGQTFRWKKSYYDHIIRSKEELISIRKYIRSNPLRGNY